MFAVIEFDATAPGNAELRKPAAGPELAIEADGLSLQVSGRPRLLRGAGSVDFEPASFLEMFTQTGIAAFDCLDGQYAIALFDSTSRTAYLARDPFGTIPLYRAHVRNWLAYSVSMADLLQLEGLTTDYDQAAIAYFLREGWAPPFTTFLKAVKPARPGYLEVFTPEAQTAHRLHPRPGDYPLPVHASEPKTLLSKVRQAVRDSGPTDSRRIGVALSGGIDSAAITALLREAHPGESLDTFTVGYGPDDPEIRGARATAAYFGTSHHELFVGPSEVRDHIEETVAILGNPGGYDELPCLSALWSLAAKHVDVLYSGNVSDAIFAGMSTHRRLWRHKTLERYLRPLGIGRAVDHGIHHKAQPGSEPCSVIGYGGASAGFRHWLGHASTLFEALKSDLDAWDERTGAQTLLARHYGIELRAPFAHKQLIEFALCMRDADKVNIFGVKRLFRRSLRSVLPASIRYRRKGIQHLRYDAEMQTMLLELVEHYLSGKSVRRRGVLDPSSVEEIKADVRYALTPTNFRYAWNAILFEIWCRKFVDGVATTTQHEAPLSIAGE
ncbi:asparagine synthetase B family protein [Mesorhizobium retamae]|uniref:asparagine synthase (glutamine-hydrolyzing) n=1 Tax=Mesorhizobium retamae TaxID=2912854 RepID=A0ABS9QM70_9HYPH|nr:asparagine synthase-related protein [Mesorhizobium sp. IRAMC:0171]MCG7508502.1 asparagine synthase-related protein [Mesorhizobium sp. IRAMC:0171]